MKYTPEQLDQADAWNLKATPGEVGAQLLELHSRLTFGEAAQHPGTVKDGEDGTRRQAVLLVASALDVVLAYAEEADLAVTDIRGQLDELLQDRGSAWIAPVEEK